jgi:hypothetical protein
MTGNGMTTGEEKLLLLSQQLDTIARVGLVDIQCPYCKGVTSPGKTFCCETIIKALNALADARDKFGNMERYWRN